LYHEKTPQQRQVAIMSHCERLNRYVFSFDLYAAGDIIIFAQGWWEIVPHRKSAVCEASLILIEIK